MLYVLQLTFCFCLLAQLVQGAQGVNNQSDTVKKVMEQARKDSAQMSIPVNTYQEEGLKAAHETAKKFYSPEFQEKLQCQQTRIKEEIVADYLNEPEKVTPAPDKLAQNEKVYFFFSSSMPDQTVHTYLAMVEGLDEPNFNMLMRGFVPEERDKYLIRITKKNMRCIDQLQSQNPKVCERYEIPIKIQPSLFGRFKVTQVPALVYERGEEVWKITGDAALDYLIERVNREVESPGLEGLVNTLRGS